MFSTYDIVQGSLEDGTISPLRKIVVNFISDTGVNSTGSIFIPITGKVIGVSVLDNPLDITIRDSDGIALIESEGLQNTREDLAYPAASVNGITIESVADSVTVGFGTVNVYVE